MTRFAFISLRSFPQSPLHTIISIPAWPFSFCIIIPYPPFRRHLPPVYPVHFSILYGKSFSFCIFLLTTPEFFI
ncbi:hypothetical protein BACCAP_02392 [Pseudoflavonifractor capillosus ATCC 29799]|uniref:Uncharacterized protein n=1 Tax=Pseudoflavonifractor capillosus ATCC 29799 TaxID=411467 RepID=A6NVZ8_9FIRM|nr:hypothetical protein BACCAP_02392 [Pseudoflavonifractor capillosus ATCC 29799]